ncbi:hypothetical protein LEP1GSC041_2579 [Leptospira noguchii str. 2006001870]|nr:hypothetical protein LEP1GSC041_2579 [Leptospira noguchii str. 2006001870]
MVWVFRFMALSKVIKKIYFDLLLICPWNIEQFSGLKFGNFIFIKNRVDEK